MPGLRMNTAMDFREQQPGPLVNYTFYSWRSERYILMATTLYPLPHTDVPLHTDLGSS